MKKFIGSEQLSPSKYDRGFGSAEIRQRIVDSVNELLLGRRSSVTFSEYLGEHNPGLVASLIPGKFGRSACYVVDDPAYFFGNLRRHPNRFTFDCLNIIPAIQYLVVYESLLDAGFPAKSVLDLFMNATMHGGSSSINIVDTASMIVELQPLRTAQGNTLYKKNVTSIPYATDVYAQDIVVGNWRSFKPKSGKVYMPDKPVPGDHFHLTHHGVHNMQTHHNYDDWNGFILQPNRNILKSKAVLLDADRSKRFQYFFAVAQQLLQRLPLHGIDKSNQKEYEKRGGLQLVVVRTDYNGLLGTLSRHLRNG